MGRQGDRQGDLMVTWSELPRSPGHVFYDRLQQVLVGAGFDGFVEEACRAYYARTMGAPSVPPGRFAQGGGQRLPVTHIAGLTFASSESTVILSVTPNHGGVTHERRWDSRRRRLAGCRTHLRWLAGQAPGAAPAQFAGSNVVRAGSAGASRLWRLGRDQGSIPLL